MQQQLFGYELYRGTPPHQRSDTSIAAAEAIRPSVNGLRARVLQFIQGQCSGATDEEIQGALQMGGSTERPRRRELVQLGLVLDSGLRRPTASGKKAAVWKTSDEAGRKSELTPMLGA